MARIISFLFLLSFSLLISCKQKTVSFSVDAPPSWTMTETLSRYKERQVRMDEPDWVLKAKFPRNIIIGIIHTGNLEGCVKEYIQEMKMSTDMFVQSASGTCIIDGRKGIWIRYQMHIGPDSPFAEQKVFFVEKHNRIFQITCSSEPDKIDSFQKEIDYVLHSFRFIP